jgi:hypothetical protein
MNEDLKEIIAEQIFPFQLYLSGKFNHNDIIRAMCEMAKVFELSWSDAIIKGYDIKQIEHLGINSADEEIK